MESDFKIKEVSKVGSLELPQLKACPHMETPQPLFYIPQQDRTAKSVRWHFLYSFQHTRDERSSEGHFSMLIKYVKNVLKKGFSSHELY